MVWLQLTSLRKPVRIFHYQSAFPVREFYTHECLLWKFVTGDRCLATWNFTSTVRARLWDRKSLQRSHETLDWFQLHLHVTVNTAYTGDFAQFVNPRSAGLLNTRHILLRSLVIGNEILCGLEMEQQMLLAGLRKMKWFLLYSETSPKPSFG